MIKGQEILPELGGGMCQISTTLFRGAMNGGLEIVERTNHSLWLHWYDDPRTHTPGTDATIYEDDSGSKKNNKDFRFKNDTNNFIAIKVRVDKIGNLYIDLWGTKDGREGLIYEPQIIKEFFVATGTATTTNLTTTKLPIGKVLCNGPFKGASTYFTYGVTDKDGKETTQNFYSYYKPQERVCNTGI